jgi:tetratricopeptide (TPR) repeat protein
VLGKTFSAQALSELSGLSDQDIDPLLSSLVRKEVLGVQSDPRSPEHGQYGFLQDLVRHVAYETLSKRERKARHLAAAGHLGTAFAEEDEVAEVLASHYLAAYEAAPNDKDAPEIRTKAREMLARAGGRAASLGAPDEGQRYYEQAAGLADGAAAEAALLEQAGRLSVPAGRLAEGRALLDRAIALYEDAGDASSAALASAALGDLDVLEGKLDEAAKRLESTLPALEQRGASPELAATLAQLGRVQALRGERDRALVTLDRALRLAERLSLEEVFVQALTSRAISVVHEGRFKEARLLLEAAVERARELELHAAWFRAAGNLGVALQDADLYMELLELSDAIQAQAKQLGDREQLAQARLGTPSVLFQVGHWAEAISREAEAERLGASRWAGAELVELARIRCERGEVAEAERTLQSYEWLRDAEHVEMLALFDASEARVLRARGKAAEALRAAERGYAHRDDVSITSLKIKLSLVEAIEAAFALGDLVRVEELLSNIEALQPGEMTPFLRGQGARFRALLDGRQGRHEALEGGFLAAEAVFREFAMAFYLTVTQLEHAEWLLGQGRADEAQPLLDEARQTFQRLEATPWLERTDAARAAPRASVPA